MALNKQPLNINFSQGLDKKTDPFQVSPGKFLVLQNSIFDIGGLLQKRNGYGQLASLPDATNTYLTTFNGNLLTLGTSISAYNASNDTWVNQGDLQPVALSTLPAIRSTTNQSQADSVISSTNLTCIVYTDEVPVAGSIVNKYKYTILDSVTGQSIVQPTLITPSTGTITGAPRVFLLGQYFIIVFTNLIAGVSHLKYIAISIANPTSVRPDVNITSQYTPSSTLAFDGYAANNNLYLAWNGDDVGGAIRFTRLDSTLSLYTTQLVSGHSATLVSVSVDASNTVYISYYDSGTSAGYIFARDSMLNAIFGNTLIISATSVNNLTSSAQNGACQIIYEVINSYTYDSAIRTDYLKTLSVSQGAAVGPTTVLARSVGLASKAFLIDSNVYVLSVYNSAYQPSYFLLNLSGEVVAKLAYSNGSGYYTTGLPNVTVSGTSATIPYLVKDLVEATNKTQGASNSNPVYSQTGINLASFSFTNTVTTSSEIGGAINLPTGSLLSYDGYSATENGFYLWPDYVEVTTSSAGGTMLPQQYFYIATYEWADNQGNVFRSAPSIPLSADMSGLGGTTCSATVHVPTLRLTYKINNPVKIVLYRWSTAQQTYYQVTSIQIPTLNDPTVDYVTILDTLPDTSILGNNILYTTGGVIENISPPAADTLTLFQSRVFLVDAENKNLIWFSKQIIQSTPVEMSDLLTIYVAPTIGAQGNTGPIKCLSSLDDKLIIFKKDALYYLTGQGPDNTGANSQFSEPTFITGTVGSDNQKSIVLTPQGLMFQSDKGIWLLGRDLSTNYIGAPVQEYTQNAVVQSAVNIPGTNQIRFTLDSGITLMYDYYYGQWGTFTNVPAISSTLYESLHTYINQYGQVFQETPGAYMDGEKPVVIGFTTSWLNLAGLQGYERAYFFTLLGSYISPHKLVISIAYDYNASPTQVTTITPDNFTPNWGGLAQWGSGSTWGGAPSLEQWRVFLQRQKCQSFQISMQEVYDPSFGVSPGAGFTLSGLMVLLGLKSGHTTIKAANSIG